MSSPTQEITKSFQHYSYSINKQIGKGFSSQVYQGIDTLTQKNVAIKVIDLRKLEKDSMHQILQSQIKIIQALDHPNVIKCQGVYITINNCYIVTQLCEEGDLATVIKKKGRLRGLQALRTMHEIAKGYQYINTLNIIHRDIKPANILIHSGTVKIADFGFARYENGTIKEKYSIGSPLYMSPQSLRDRIYSKHGDIWSLGVVYYEILQGRPPWNPKNQKQLKGIFDARSDMIFRIAIRDQLETMIKRCLDYDLKTRITIEEIIGTLDSLISQMNQNGPQNAYRQTLTRRPSYTNIIKSPLLSTPHILRKQNSMTNLDLINKNKQNSKQCKRITHELINQKLINIRSATELKLANREAGHCNKTEKHDQVNKIQQTSIEEASRHNHRILKSLINFARFVYKLFPKMQTMKVQKWLTQRLEVELLGILRFTITALSEGLKKGVESSITKYNRLGIKLFNKFVETRCYTKTVLVVEQYLVRYSSFCNKKKSQIITPQSPHKIPEFESFKDFADSSQRIKQILKLVNVIHEEEGLYLSPEQNDHNITIDYLVSMVILLKMLSLEEMENFAQKSSIQEIVDTSPTRLDKENIEELAQKMKLIWATN